MYRHIHKSAPAVWGLAAVVLATVVGVPALAADSRPLELSLASFAADEAQSAQEMTESACPISLGVSYYLYSDYIFRGVNFSEYQGEGREKPNHQITTTLSLDLGDFGTVGLDTFFEWFAAQKKIDPLRGGQNLQEVDYVVWWAYSLEAIATDLTLGYTFFEFPNLANVLRQDTAVGNNNDDRTHEYWVSLEHNDAWMWKWLLPDNEEGVLNPSFYFAHDVGAIGGVWMELGFSHPFAIPGIDNFTITPGHTLAADCNYWSDGFKLAYDLWSLVLEYDLTSVLHLPAWAGNVSITGELYFNNALGNMEDAGVLQDEFWGGTSVNWSWGG